MSRLEWRADRKYNVLVAGNYKKDFESAATKRPGIADHPAYPAAKYGNDAKAALQVVESALDRLYLAKVKIVLNELANGPHKITDPILVAPYKETSKNRLARVAAAYLGDKLGLAVDQNITERPDVSMKNLGKLERMFNSPDFDGAVEKGRWYIAVDDTVSSGTTMAALRSHIVANGGRFVCGLALASPTGSNVVLNPSKDDIKEIATRLSHNVVEWFERMSRVPLAGLTKSQADFLQSPNGRRELIGYAAQTGFFQS